MQANDALVNIGGAGYDGSAFTGIATGMTVFANQTWTGSARGSYLTLFTTPNGSLTGTTRVRIGAEGIVTHSLNTTAIGSLAHQPGRRHHDVSGAGR